MSEEERECIEICIQAAEVTKWCADEGFGSEEMAVCARLCRDVADITLMPARFMASGSAYSHYFVVACVETSGVHRRCEQPDTVHCQVTAEILWECADSCRTMANV